MKNLRRRKGFSTVRQRDTMQCGVACLAMICRAYGTLYLILVSALAISAAAILSEGFRAFLATIF